MSPSDDYCDLCDLPRTQCVHGLPPAPPKAAPTKTPSKAPSKAPPKRPTTRAAKPRTPGTPATPVRRRWTPPEVFKPLIVGVLEEAGGELEAEDLFLELEIVAEDRLLPGDRERTPEGELRWWYAARRARQALISEGAMTRGAPGIWQLARPDAG
jgi:hypothetical protein